MSRNKSELTDDHGPFVRYFSTLSVMLYFIIFVIDKSSSTHSCGRNGGIGADISLGSERETKRK
jgi:hypothetical protein